MEPVTRDVPIEAHGLTFLVTFVVSPHNPLADGDTNFLVTAKSSAFHDLLYWQHPHASVEEALQWAIEQASEYLQTLELL